jgi:signal transduction histidine kinase/ActR/RegA family two-component response regulator
MPAKQPPDSQADVAAPPSRAAPIIERAPLAMVEVHGPAYLVSHVNAAFCALIGKDKSELIGKPFANVVPGGDDVTALLAQVYQSGKAATLARAIAAAADDARADDDATWLYAMWPALDATERPAGVVIQLTKATSYRENLTAMNEALLLAGLRQHQQTEVAEELNNQLRAEVAERQRVEESLRASQEHLRVVNERLALADRNKDDFLAMLAHELRNPLAPIKNAAHLLHTLESDNPVLQRASSIIERQADHLAKLVDELLDVSRIQNGKIRINRERINLVDAVLRSIDACESVTTSHDQTVTVDVGSQAIYVDADATRIDQILVNLIMNASKYTPSQGHIRVRLANESGMAVVRIKDSGIGISPDMLQRVFEMFTQVEQSIERSRGGLGLGLMLVRELLALHGGTVEASSEGLDKGSEFIVRLPVVEAPEVKPVSVAAAPARAAGARRILVVDDIVDNRETMDMLLSKYGHSVQLAEDGQEALDKALHGDAEIAFVDIGLPKLSGYDVARAIRSSPRGAQLVLIALSGYGQPEDKRKALDAGFDAHMTKPVDPEALLAAVDGLEEYRRP